MHDHDPTEDLGVTCPSGTNFYICKSDPSQFIGCCAINPCSTRKGLCPDQHLKPATFDKAYEEYILPQACINDNVDVAWHACSWSTSSFMGCCAVDPCNGGCPARQLRAAKLSDDAKNAECFLGGEYGYEPKPSYTSSSSLDPTTSTSACSTTTFSTTIVSTTASSFTTSIVTTSASSTSMSSSPKPTSAPPKDRGGPELRYCWILLLLVLPILYCARRASIKRSKLRETKRDINNSDRFWQSSDNESVERTAIPQTNPSINKRDNRPLPLKRGLSYHPQLDVQTGDGRTANQKEFPQPDSDSLLKRDKSLPTLEEMLLEKGKSCSPKEESIVPSRQHQQPVNKGMNSTYPSFKGDVPASINPKFGGRDTEYTDSPSPEEPTGPRILIVTNPDPPEESSGASTLPRSTRVPSRGRTKKRQRPQILRKSLSPLSEESVGWENGSR
ncbi:uncharacterized protein FIESC28_08457 [Fusarium coffeatum]|uniref:Uncharacterized protein n=1 Tax=Fusarium coffeatum TaxID=231269 RepID=A0A366R9A7_9HYPO|nr:uncharacterized protein FIESC28_08457 [Fusarium coffeatum]RBR12755.1 hypothetical protein FIESC28_08457 [Fusarium coffeatum]